MDRSVGVTIRIGWSSASTGNVKWQLEYRWLALGEDTTQGAEETLTAVDAADNITADGLVVTDITGMVGTDAERIFYVDTMPPQLILNQPNGSYIVTTNNVTFNFTVFDNVDLNISCNLSVDGDIEDSGDVSNGSDSVNYLLYFDGDHYWSVVCWDDALNYNYSETISFTIEAPPNVSLDSPDGSRTDNPNVTFFYTPYDPLGITKCELYIDDVYNNTDSNPTKNQQNNFTVYGIGEGSHNWTVNCTDSDDNTFQPDVKNFIVDQSPPNITLINPENDSGVDINLGDVDFQWIADDEFVDPLRCNLSIDGVIEKSNILVSDGVLHPEPVSLSEGWHIWNVTCWDSDLPNNVNTSITWEFNLTYPDFEINITGIGFNASEPEENEVVLINATISNLGGASSENIIVRFYDGDPDLEGVQINSDKSISISKYSKNSTSVEWSSEIGTNEIYVVVDPPIATNGSFDERNESNNKASRNISIGGWQFFYGDVLSYSEYRLSDNESSKLIKWFADDFQNGNIYVTDYEAEISWSDLVEIGKNISGDNSSINDFSDIDSLLNMSDFNDSVYNLSLIHI